MSYWFILIPLCLYLFLLVKGIMQAKRIFTFYNLLLMWYLLSLVCNIASGLFFSQQYRLGNVLYFTFVVYLFIVPFRSLRVDSELAELAPPGRYFRIVAVVVITLCLASIVSDFARALAALRIEDLAAFRQSVSSKGTSLSVIRPQQSALEIVVRCSGALYFISLTMFFVALARGYSRVLTTLLFVSSFSTVVFYLTQAGRSGIVLWLFFFGINGLFYQRFIDPRIVTIGRKACAVMAVFLFTIFVAISWSRFSNYFYFSAAGRIVTNPFVGALDYFGQSLAVFDQFVETGFSPGFHGAFLFPLIDRVLSYWGVFPNTLDWMYGVIRASIPDNCNAFGTFLRELWYDFGPLGVIAVGVGFNIIVRRLCNELNGRIRVRSALLLFSLYSVPFMGLFSYPMSQMHENVGLLAVLLIPF